MLISRTIRTVAVIFLGAICASCISVEQMRQVDGATIVSSRPLDAVVLSPEELPRFEDDLDFDRLVLALDRQQAAFAQETGGRDIQIANRTYHRAELAASLDRFKAIVVEAKNCLSAALAEDRQGCLDRFNTRIREEFQVFLFSSPLLTAYYTPTIDVSVQADGSYPYPIYRTPASESERRYSRDQIDFQHRLAGQGYELFYAKSLFDIYVLHIEGGGKVVVHDGDGRYVRYMHYAADNGLDFRQIGDVMVEQGMLSSDHQSRYDQRQYLTRHPEEVRAILSSCPGYVFFDVSNRSPVGSNGMPLTGGRSMATDPSYYPIKGLVAYLEIRVPETPPATVPPDSNPQTRTKSLKRFFVDQDIGHFLYGAARADLFFGEGRTAEFLANNLQTSGKLYFLLLK